MYLHPPYIFMIGTEAIYSLYPLSKAHVNTQTKLHFSWMSSGIVPSPKSSVPVRRLLVLHNVFVSGKQAAGHILCFLISVSLPSRRHKSIYIEVNKLKVMKPSTLVWHHTPTSPRGRLSSSHAFRLVPFRCSRSSADNRLCFAPHSCRRPTF